MSKRIAPTLHWQLVRNPADHYGDIRIIQPNLAKCRAELRALLRCARVLRRLRAAGGGWDVDARYEADQALAAVSGKAGRKW